jgi:hypothetical protein
MIKPFAKLFTFPDIGQVLGVIDDTGEHPHGPELVISFTPSENLGVCAVRLSFMDNDDGWAAAQKAFDELDEKKARSITDPVIKDFGDKFGARLAGEA